MGVIKRIGKVVRRLWRDSMNSEVYVNYLRKQGIKVGENVNFRHPEHTTIDVTRPCLIEFGSNLDINDNFALMTHDFGSYVFRNLYDDFVPSSGKVKIGNNIYFGRNVTILKGVTIGDNCIIGACSLVTKDIPSNTVACGVPAKVVCSIDDYYMKRKSECIDEALEYAATIMKERQPIVTDFKEEWSLFFRESDYEHYPQMHQVIDWRLKQHKDAYWQKHNPVFNGYNEFIQRAKQRIE